MRIKATKGAFRFCESKTTEEKSLDTKWGKQISLKEGSAELSSALMSVKLDEENIEIVSNQTIDISAGEELNIGKSIFISKDKDGNEIVTI